MRIRSKHRGLALMDVGLWSMAMMTGLGLRLAADSRVFENQWAGNVGQELYVLSSAIQQLSADQPFIADGTYEAWDILRSVDCDSPGIAEEHYLPCDFEVNSTLIGQYFENIEVSSVPSSVPGVPVKNVALNMRPIARHLREADPALSGMVAATAIAMSTSSNSPIETSVISNISMDRDTGAVSASYVSDPTTNVLLRADGITRMRGTLHFGQAGDDPGFAVTGVKDIVSDRFVDWDDRDFVLDPAGVSRLNQAVSESEVAVSRIDSIDGSQTIDPSGKTRVDKISVNDFSFPSLAVRVWDRCETPGRVVQNSDGVVLTCVDGQWRDMKLSVPSGTVVWYDRDRCPDGFSVYGGLFGRMMLGRGFHDWSTPWVNVRDQGGTYYHRFSHEEMSPDITFEMMGSDAVLSSRYPGRSVLHRGQQTLSGRFGTRTVQRYRGYGELMGLATPERWDRREPSIAMLPCVRS